MDKFTKTMFIVAFSGAIIASAWRAKIDNYEAQVHKLAIDEQQYRISGSMAEAAEVDNTWCYGGVFDHLELEKEYIAWVDARDRYIGKQVYTGDHWSDPRILVVEAESTGQIVQVMLLKSYEDWENVCSNIDEVPD